MNEPVASDSESADLPRLRIHHLLVLTTIFSVVMTVHLGIWRLFLRSSRADVLMPEISSSVSILYIAKWFSISACIAVVFYGLIWRRRGLGFPRQPGHWMAIYLASGWVLEIVRSAVTTLVIRAEAYDWFVWASLTPTLIFHCLMFFLCTAAFRSEKTRIWKWGWGAIVARSTLVIALNLFYVLAKCLEWLLEVFWYNQQFDWQPFQSIGSYAGFLTFRLPGYLLITFLVVATVSDFRRNRSYHWSHWLVLASVFVSTSISTVYYWMT